MGSALLTAVASVMVAAIAGLSSGALIDLGRIHRMRRSIRTDLKILAQLQAVSTARLILDKSIALRVVAVANASTKPSGRSIGLPYFRSS